MVKNPILISVPHSGTQFPEEVHSFYSDEVIAGPTDTDWFVDRLYDFAEELEIELIVAPYSRYVIDLNRDPSSQSLYKDGRSETSLVPSKSFAGKDILKKKISEEEINKRLEKYYWPYYKNISQKLALRKEKFGKALLFDAHSIKRNVPTIRKEDFPDMILGSADERSAHKLYIDLALKELGAGPFELTHNTPFKGGHITRYFGKPENNIHALQLEMSQDIYMDEKNLRFEDKKANKVRPLLKNFFAELKNSLEKN